MGGLKKLGAVISQKRCEYYSTIVRPYARHGRLRAGFPEAV